MASYPRVAGDNGRGMHGAPGGDLPFDSLTQYPQLVAYFKDWRDGSGITMVKLLGDGSDKSLMACKAADEAGLCVVLRLVVEMLKPNPTQRTDVPTIAAYRAVGVPYFEFTNEPHLRDEWTEEPSVEKLCYMIFENVKTITAAGGIALLPAMPGGTRQDVENGTICYRTVLAKLEEMSPGWLKQHADNGDIAAAAHPYFGNKVIVYPDESVDFSYPNDPVHQSGRPLTAAEIAYHGLSQWEAEEMNRQRMIRMKPGETIDDDATCIRDYEAVDDAIVAIIGRSIPLFWTEVGPVVGDDWDPTYVKVTANTHRILAMEICRRLNPKHPKAFRPCVFGVFFWVYDLWGHLNWPSAPWVGNMAGDPNDGWNLPAVAALKRFHQTEEFAVDGSVIVPPIVIVPPVIVPPPEPTPSGLFLKLAPHAQADRPGLKEAIISGHFRLAKTMFHSAEFWRDVKVARPDLFIVGRLYDQWQVFTDNPEQRGQAFADKILAETPASELYDAVESYNEFFGYNNPNDWDAADRFMAAFYDRIKERAPRLEPVAGNCGVGNLLGADWVAHFPRTLARYRLFGFHEYSWPSLQGDDGWRVLRYRKIMPSILTVRPDALAIITECGLTNAVIPGQPDVGYRTIMEPEQYWQELRWYNDRLNADAYVLGACVFQMGAVLGGSPDWSTFEVLGTSIIDRMAELPAGPAIRIDSGAPPPEEANMEFVFGFKVLHDANPEIVGEATSEQVDVPGVFSVQFTEKGVLLYRDGAGAKFFAQALPKA